MKSEMHIKTNNPNSSKNMNHVNKIGKTGLFSAVCIASAVMPAVAGISPERRAEAARQASAIIAQMTPEERLAELMMDAPGEVTQKQLDELHIALNLPEKD